MTVRVPGRQLVDLAETATSRSTMALRAPTNAAYPSEASLRLECVTTTPATIAGRLKGD